jgi:hypothetical protein
MSYTEYLRNKLSDQPKITAIRKPTDASVYTQKTRMAAAQKFFANGTGVGSLYGSTDRPANNHASTSFYKNTGKGAAASDYTTFVGSTASALDINAQKSTAKKSLPCFKVPDSSWKYLSASDSMRLRKCTDDVSRVMDSPGAPLFEDNTIRLSAMNTRQISACCGTDKIENANHKDFPRTPIGVDRQRYAVGKPFFRPNPPRAQAPNVSNNKVGGYLGPRTKLIEEHHGFVKRTDPIPEAPGGQGQFPEQLKINKPTLFNIKP